MFPSDDNASAHIISPQLNGIKGIMPSRASKSHQQRAKLKQYADVKGDTEAIAIMCCKKYNSMTHIANRQHGMNWTKK